MDSQDCSSGSGQTRSGIATPLGFWPSTDFISSLHLSPAVRHSKKKCLWRLLQILYWDQKTNDFVWKVRYTSSSLQQSSGTSWSGYLVGSLMLRCREEEQVYKCKGEDWFMQNLTTARTGLIVKSCQPLCLSTCLPPNHQYLRSSITIYQQVLVKRWKDK